MQPLTIIAQLMTGFAARDPWSPALDGILAYQVMRQRLGAEAFALAQHRHSEQQPVTGLPLQRIDWDAWWWYAASAPIYQCRAEVVRHVHRRFDARAAERWWGNAGKSGRVLTAAGPYKAARLPLHQYVTPEVRWQVIGDAAAIRPLLDATTHIGARYGIGYGRVRAWTIEPAGDAARQAALCARPLPVGHAMARHLAGPRMIWGLRPPARHPDNCTECALPAADHADA